MNEDPRDDCSAGSLEPLHEFVGGDDRDETPIFSGRADEIGAACADLELRLRRWKAGANSWRSVTWILQGAPGAGKTALLEHFRETLPEEYAHLEMQAVRLQTASGVDGWKAQIAEGLYAGAGDDLRAMKQVEAGVSWEFVQGKRARTEPVLTWESLQERIRSGRVRPRPVLLLIDEVQKVEGELPGEEPQGKFLNFLHENPDNLPIFPFYGGLAHSAERIGDAGGPSRFSEGHVLTLAPLSKAECGELMRNFVAEFDIRASASALDEWTETLAEESQGWPKHLHSHLKVIGKALLQNGRDLDALGAGERAAIAEEAAMRRDEYYGALLLRKGLLGLPCLAAMGASAVARSEQPLRVGSLGDRIEEISSLATTGDLRLPPGATGKEFAEAMVRSGLLHKAPAGGPPGAPESGTLSVPIPSMPDYLLRAYGLTAPEANPKPEGAPAPRP